MKYRTVTLPNNRRMPITIELKQGDTTPITVELRENGEGKAFVTNDSVVFNLIDTQYFQGEIFEAPYSTEYTNIGSHTLKLDGYACTKDADQTTNPGSVSWTPLAAHVDTAGDFYGEFEVTYADGSVGHFPTNPEDLRVRINPKIG